MSLRSDLEILNSSLEAGYVGGGYYNPVDEFMQFARRVLSEKVEKYCSASTMSLTPEMKATYVVATVFREITASLKSDECFFAVYDTGKYRFAVLIPTEERLMDFETRVHDGGLRRYGFFALNRKQADVGLVRDFSPIA
jgi:hypothetical protein